MQYIRSGLSALQKEHEEMSKHQSTWILLAILIILAGCTSPGPQSTGPVSTKPSTNIPTTTSTPVPPIPTVGPVPRACPISNPTRHAIGGMDLIGTAPIWAMWIPGPSVYTVKYLMVVSAKSGQILGRRVINQREAGAAQPLTV